MNVPTTQAAFIFKQKSHSQVPTSSQSFGGKKPKATTKMTRTSHQLDQEYLQVTIFTYKNAFQ